MSQQDLIGLICSIANTLRGPYRPPHYRKVMNPLTLLRRFDCALGPTKAKKVPASNVRCSRGFSQASIERWIQHQPSAALGASPSSDILRSGSGREGNRKCLD